MVPPGTARYLCGENAVFPDGTATLEITDTTTNAKVDVDRVTTFVGCVRDDGSFAVFRRDPATGHQVLWKGPYQQTEPVALPLDVLHVVATTYAAGHIWTAIAFGASPAQPSAGGLYTIDLTSGAVAEAIPAIPASAAWAPGAPQAGSLQATSVTEDVGIYLFYGRYIYARKMSDGGSTLFVGPFSSGGASELALFQLSASGTGTVGRPVTVDIPDDVAGPQLRPRIIGWQVDGTGGAPSQLVVWDGAASQVTVCPSSPGAVESGVISPDGAHLLFRPLQLSGQMTSFTPLQVLDLEPGVPHTCTALKEGAVVWADFSGDGSTIAWIERTQVGLDSDLWTANSDGSDAKMILSGPLFGARFVAGTTHLEMSYGGDLVVLDVRDPTAFSYPAEQLFGDATGIGGSWFVAGYNYSNQDASGLLGVVNLDSAQKLPISPAVNQYLVSPQTAPVDGGTVLDQTATGVYDVVYLVRGRNPSPQDGLWLATVRPADLP